MLVRSHEPHECPAGTLQPPGQMKGGIEQLGPAQRGDPLLGDSLPDRREKLHPAESLSQCENQLLMAFD